MFNYADRLPSASFNWEVPSWEHLPLKGWEMFAPWSVGCSVYAPCHPLVPFFLGCHIFEEGITGYLCHLDSHKVARNVMLPRVFSRCCMFIFPLPGPPWFPFSSSSKGIFILAVCWRTLAVVLWNKRWLGSSCMESQTIAPQTRKGWGIYTLLSGTSKEDRHWIWNNLQSG